MNCTMNLLNNSLPLNKKTLSLTEKELQSSWLGDGVIQQQYLVKALWLGLKEQEKLVSKPAIFCFVDIYVVDAG